MKEKGYKQTEIGLIPDDWELKKFKDVSFMKGRIGWQGLKQTEFNFNSDDPFLITGMNFKDGEIKWNEVYHVPFERYEIAKEIQLKEDDVLMTKDGTIGKLLYVNKIPYPHFATLNSHLLVFRPLKKFFNPKYLYYNLSSPYFFKHIELTKSGTTFFGVSQESVGEYNLILPPISEQTAIANALSDADAYISSLETLIAKKRLIKQGVMQQLLTPKKGWVEKYIKDVIINFQNGFGFSATGYVENGTPIVTMAQIGLDGSFNFIESNVNKWVTSDFDLLKNYHLKDGDLIIAMTDVTPEKNLIGRMAIVKTNQTLLLNQRVGLLRLDPNKVNTYFLKTLSNMRSWRSYCIGSASLGVQANIGTKDIMNGEISLPRIDEQNEIATALIDMDDEIYSLEQKLSKAKLIKQGMMQELLTGKIRLV
jgi:type I restriction enzyme S subunit